MEPISAGDTVEVVETCPCGGVDELLGVYTVVEHTTERMRYISHCGRTDIFTRLAMVTLAGIRDYYPVRWLRRVPPLTELDKIDSQDRIPEKEYEHV